MWCHFIISIHTDGSSEDSSPCKSDFKPTSERLYTKLSLGVIFQSEGKKTPSEQHTWKCAAGWKLDTAAFAQIQGRLCLGKYPDISEVLLGVKKKKSSHFGIAASNCGSIRADAVTFRPSCILGRRTINRRGRNVHQRRLSSDGNRYVVFQCSGGSQKSENSHQQATESNNMAAQWLGS